MSQSENRKLRTLLLSVLCLSVWLGAAGVPALAQRRVPSNAPPETPSQRWLPLPQGGSADLKQQVQWLQQLKGLLGTDPLGGESPALPKFDPEQMKTLLEMMKQMSGGPPDGTQPPALNGVSPEQVSKAMADPALREQVRRMLDQFSKDGKLPQGGGDTDPRGASIPSAPTKRNQGTGDESPDQNRPAPETGQDSTAMPRAMQELLQRLAQQAGRQPNGLPPERDSAADSSLEQEPGGDNRNSSRPGAPRVKPGAQRTNARSPTNDEVPLNAGSTDTATPGTKPIPRTGRQIGERGEGADDSPNDPNRPTPSPGAAPRPAGSQPRGTTQPPGGPPSSGPAPQVGTAQPKTAERMSGADARSGTPRNREPMPEPTLPASVAEILKNVPQDRDQIEPGQAGSRDPRPDTSERRSSNPRDSRLTNPPQNSRPSMSDASNGPPTVSTRPSMDVRSELEEQGFAQTLRKIVEQAREETLVASNDSSGSSAEGSAARDGSTGGLEGSATRMLDGLRKNLVETANERPGQSTASETMRPESARPPASQPDASRSSPSSPLSNAAKSIFSDIATAPASTPAPAQSSPTASSGAVVDPQGAGSRSTLGLLMLLAVLGLVWYFIPQLLAAIGQSQRAGSPLGAEIHPADIRTRRDVVRAFHQYALRPATPAPTWWTHREVERQVAATTPALQPTIQTLVDLYEQARYLPDDTDFTPDQIGSARRALEQCESTSLHEGKRDNGSV